MLSKIFNFSFGRDQQTRKMTSSALILGIFYFISAVLGLFRDRLLAGRFGAGRELDIYFAAFRIPDFVYSIVILGGLIVAFLPLFAEYFSRNEKEAWEMTSHVLNAFLFCLILLSAILFIFAPLLIDWLFPGFSAEEVRLAIPLVRLLFLSPILFGVSNLLSGILQYFRRFFVYGLTPILYNLGIIFGILFLSPRFGIFGVGMGVVLGAFCHMAFQIPWVIKCGFSYKPFFSFDFKYPAIGRIFKLMVPRVFGVAAQQINLIVITSIASLASVGAIAIFNFSNNLQSLPIGVIGTSFAIVIFPALSKSWASNRKDEFLKNFSVALRQILVFVIPISVLIILFREQIIGLILKTGQFGLTETKLTAACLGIFSVSIFAQSLIPLLSRAFFSLQDTKTPTMATFFGVTLNIVLALSFVQLLGSQGPLVLSIKDFFGLSAANNISIIGLPLAFSISAIFQFFLLHVFFRKKMKKIN